MNRTIVICENADDLARHAADVFQQAAHDAIIKRGRFVAALAGGSTPKKTYQLLAQPERAEQIAWDKTFCFFGDERFVPQDDERSNFHTAQDSLLARVPIPAANIFAVDTTLKTAADAARAYADTLATFFNLNGNAAPPVFDLVLLGLGDDGHTASLFPGMSSLAITDKWVIDSPPGILPPPVDRITFTFPVLNAARRVAFLVSGANKADAVHDILDNQAPLEKRPAAGVHPSAGALLWFLDRDAAAQTSAR